MLTQWRNRWSAIAKEFAQEFSGLLGLTTVMLPLSALLLWVEWRSGDLAKFLTFLLYLGTTWIVFILPVIAAARHHWRQARAMDKIRAKFAQGLEALNAGQMRQAERLLMSVLRWERHWKYGNSWIYRTAYGALVMLFTGACGFIHWVAYYSIFEGSGASRKEALTPVEAMQYLVERPFLLGLIGTIAMMWSLTALVDLRHIKESAWRDFYSTRLASALKAGRNVGAARPLEEAVGISAQELFGLNEHFTKAQLRVAWLRLARELHPDRWMHADAATRGAKEAALKRVNSLRDQLEHLAR